MKHQKTGPSPAPGMSSSVRARWGFESIPFEWRDVSTWPTVDISGLDADVQARFERLSKGIKHFVASRGDLKGALEEAKCHKKVFYAQLARCVSPADGLGTIVGWAGLLRKKRLKSYQRTKDGSDARGSEGQAGRFTKWLRDNPAWERTLIKLINQGGGGKKIASQAPTVRGVAAQFIAQIKGSLPETQYPRTAKSCGRRSIERYIANHIAMDASTTKVWFGTDVASRQHLGTGHFNFPLATAPFDMMGCDAHTVDAIGILIIDGPSGPQRVPVERMKIVPLICLVTRCITGYTVCIQSQVSALHIEAAYLMGTRKWTPLQLTIDGLKYDVGAGFPVGVVEGLDEVLPSGIQLDNAAQHYGKGVQQRIRTSVGCLVRWGGVGRWWRNAVMERFFQTLTAYGFKHLPSSMGSGPQDPLRADNPVAEAAGKGIEWHELIQLLDVLIANYNCRPSKALGGRSPLEAVRSALHMRTGTWQPRMSAPYTATSPRPGIELVEKRVNGYVKSRVAPYVELDDTRYSSPELSERYDWIGKRVYLHVPEDMRLVEAFLETGERVGVLRCLNKGWSLSAHSRQQRKLINDLIKAGELSVPEGGNPVAVYLDHLAKKAYGSAVQTSSLSVSAPASAAADLMRSTRVVQEKVKTPDRAANDARLEQPQLRVGVRLPTHWK